jgi:hypothetical protein
MPLRCVFQSVCGRLEARKLLQSATLRLWQFQVVIEVVTEKLDC